MKEVSVEVKDLTVKFGDFFAVNKVSFSVARGEIFGFLGANGAGKTTTIRVLCGLLEPTEGQVRVAGRGFDSGAEAIKAKVGYMSQKFTLYDDLTVAENLSFTGALRKMKPELLKKRVSELLSFVGFDRPLNTLVRDLPGGIRQQVSLAAATLHDPEIVFLDEPTAGVTPAFRAKFWTLIRNLSGRGKTVFVTTHYMDEAEQCERIALMRSGEIIALDTPDRLKDVAFPEVLYELEPIHEEASSLIARLKNDKAVVNLQVHGLRYHVAARTPEAWKTLSSQLEKDFRIRRIRPSLEDVFIRLVEGDSR